MHTLTNPIVINWRFVQECMTFYWTPGVKGLNNDKTSPLPFNTKKIISTSHEIHFAHKSINNSQFYAHIVFRCCEITFQITKYMGHPKIQALV